MESQDEEVNDRKRSREQGVVDRQAVVRDLENTISNLFTYLTSNSPAPQELTSSGDLRLVSNDETQRSREVTPADSVSFSPREVVYPVVFRPVSEADSNSRSHLITPTGAFHAISEAGLPPPIPRRGPPVDSPSNFDLFSSSVDKRYSPVARSILSRASPSPSRWITESPFGINLRDRKSLMSSVNSKGSSDIELVNLFRGESVNDALSQSFCSSDDKKRTLDEENRQAKASDNDCGVSAFASPAKTKHYEGKRLGINLSGEPSLNYNTKFPSSGKRFVNSPNEPSLRRTPVQYQTSSETRLDVRLAESSEGASSCHLQEHMRSSLTPRVSVQSLPLLSHDKVRHHDHHYSEVDIYDPAQLNCSTMGTGSPNTTTSTPLSPPPPIPHHCQGKSSFTVNKCVMINKSIRNI
ncbi:uncharacterized protein [Procambarus clarkii]|uniref:uncharacterized protein n=1 Tax=Procambarus clarkii TaxID=6728 RepID=UPI003743CD53